MEDAPVFECIIHRDTIDKNPNSTEADLSLALRSCARTRYSAEDNNSGKFGRKVYRI